MTFTLSMPTAIAQVNAIVDAMDGGGNSSGRGTGRVRFTDGGAGDALVAELNNVNSNGNILDPAFQDAVDATDRARADIANGPWEDDVRTVAGTITDARFENTDDAEVFACDVAPSNADIIMSNPTVGANDPVRLSAYGVFTLLVN